MGRHCGGLNKLWWLGEAVLLFIFVLSHIITITSHSASLLGTFLGLSYACDSKNELLFDIIEVDTIWLLFYEFLHPLHHMMVLIMFVNDHTSFYERPPCILWRIHATKKKSTI